MTDDPPCPVCESPLYDNATICNACRNYLETCLLEVGRLMNDLDVTLTKQSQTRSHQASTELDPTPTPFHVGASKVGQDLRATMAAWCALVRDGTGHAFTRKPSPVNLAAYLVVHLPWLAHHEAAPDAYNEVTAACQAIEKVIDIDPGTRIVGICGHETEDGPCPQTVWAHLYAATVQCMSCGQLWDVRERRLESYAHAYTTAATATTITRAFMVDGIAISAHRLAVWAGRGLLTPAAPRRYVVAHVARLIQLSEAGVKLTNYETEANQP